MTAPEFGLETRKLYLTLEDIENLEPPEWIVEDIIPRRSKCLFFGESGGYKSTHLLDMLCHVAHDVDYHGVAINGSYPVVFIVNEDAYGFMTLRMLGWHRYYGRKPGRVIVLPNNTKLTDEGARQAIACAESAFGTKKAIFAIDTWDRSIEGNPNSTEDVNPALSSLDLLLSEGGEATIVVSHSPWSDKERTKGSVTFWANHETRIRCVKDQATGKGTFRVVHQKNGPSGLELGFEFEAFEFEHRGKELSALIPKRDFDHVPLQAGPKPKPLGGNERIVLDSLLAAICDQADPTPPANDIPGNVKGASHERWKGHAMRYLPQEENYKKKEAFGRAAKSLIAKRKVHSVDGFVWPA